MNEIIPQQSDTCITCGTELIGNFCTQCGEKKLNPSKDYSIGKFLEQTVDAFTHFDSKFLRSFKALLLKPGFLTSEFIRGKRTPYMKPVQIYLVATILFYFIFPTNSTFYSSVDNMTDGNILNYEVSKAVQRKMATDSTSMRLVVKGVNEEAAHKSKAFLFLIIPFWGVCFYLLFRKSISFLVPHVVLAVHNLSFFILLFLLYLAIFSVFGHNLGELELIPLMIIFFIYMFISIRKVYRENAVRSIMKSLLSFSSFFLLVVLYRQAITIWALSS